VPRVPRAVRLALLGVLFFKSIAAAQTPDQRLPWWVVDLHAATVGLPQAEGWVPVLPTGTLYPGRSWGVAGGGMIYPLRFSKLAFGVGASVIAGSGTLDTVTVTGSGTTATSSVTQTVHTGITSVVPQVSINFGRRLGWSYLSAGAGPSKVTSSNDAVGTTPAQVVPEAWNQALNFGGGAKWFMKPHLGAGFDVRWVKLMNRGETDTLPAAKRTQVWNISAGISIQ
jgi:hypothetical protein